MQHCLLSVAGPNAPCNATTVNWSSYVECAVFLCVMTDYGWSGEVYSHAACLYWKVLLIRGVLHVASTSTLLGES